MADPIVTHALGKAFRSLVALEDVSLRVPTGQAVGLIGSNGAGKSTTLRSISGLTHPRSGKIRLQGKDLQGVPAHKIAMPALGKHSPARDWSWFKFHHGARPTGGHFMFGHAGP